MGWLLVASIALLLIGQALRSWKGIAYAIGVVLTAAGVTIPIASCLIGCPKLPPPDGCEPLTTRCSATGVPQVCSSTGRWTQLTGARPCSAYGAVCCYTRTPYTDFTHACVKPSTCLDDPPVERADAGE